MSEEISNTKDTAVQTSSQNKTNSKNGSFFQRHKLLVIGLILFIIVYVISNQFPAWMDYERVARDSRSFVVKGERDYASGGFMRSYFRNLFDENSIFSKIPLEFIYYGIADIASAVHFSVYFTFGIVTIGLLLLEKVLDRLGNADNPLVERYIVNYLYANILFYPLSFFMRFMEPLFIKGLDAFGSLSDNDMPFIFKILFVVVFLALMLVIILGLLAPTLVNYLFFFLYIIALKPVKSLIFALHDLIGRKTFVQNFLSAVVTLVILLVFNILVEILLQKCQKLSLMPIKWLIGKIKKKFSRKKQTVDISEVKQ